MNFKHKLNHLWTIAVLLAAVQGLTAAAPDAKPADSKAAAAKEPVKEVPVPKSVFEYDNKKGKDPFFPKSIRWTPVPKQPEVSVKPDGTPAPPPPPPPKKNPYDFFELKGMTGVGNNRLVVINSGVKGKNYLLGIGESKTVVTPEGNYKVKVESFSDLGVVIKIDGEKAPKEIKLPTGP